MVDKRDNLSEKKDINVENNKKETPKKLKIK